MFGNLDYTTLQVIWWTITSVVGALFVFLQFVQGGQSMLFTLPRSEEEKDLIINSLGRKWELTFTTLVLFGGALFAAFPKFYATSFGGAYWVWMAILFTFIIQAVSYEYRKKPDNFLGARTYEIFLFINGTVGLILIGTAVGTFYTGSNFSLNAYNQVSWHTPLRGLEAASNMFNVAFGVMLVFLARTMAPMYLLTNIDHQRLQERCRRSVLVNFLWLLPFLLFVLLNLVTMNGFAVDEASGAVIMEKGKYLHNLLANPLLLIFLLAGLGLVIYSVFLTSFQGSDKGIWFGGLGVVLTALTVFLLPAFNNTPFYPSVVDPQSSLTIFNASSSKYTLTVMTYVALMVPFVLAYVSYLWKMMDSKKISLAELKDSENAKKMY
ncbi:MAG: cytochrome d ubiquinol oxidase subunit II [Thermodesulfobacteriota bacterium]